MLYSSLIKRAEEISSHSAFELPEIKSWKANLSKYRQQWREMLGLEPLPKRTDLKVITTGILDRDHYVIEKIHYQPIPGARIPANLYRPKKINQALPAVVYVCGHSSDGKATPQYQAHARWFGEHGYICMILDPIQVGEGGGLHNGTFFKGWWHWFSQGYTPAGVEVWAAMRAFDYLETREDVDNNRFGITGLSGGGTMSWFTGAADERIKVICPVCQTGTIEQHIRERTIDGHCDCTFWTNTYGWDFPDVACLIAPRPLLVSAATEDILFRPYAYRSLVHRVRMLYRVYNKEENIGLVEDVSKHGYTPKIRLAIFNWFEKYLKGSSATITDDISDREETTKTLSVYKAGKPPENDRMKKIDRFFIPLPKQMTFEKKKEWQKYQCQAIETLRTVTFRSFPKKISLPYANARRDGEDENFQYRTYEFETEPDLLIRARLCIPIAAPKPYSVVVAPLSLDARSPFMGQGAGLEGLNSMIAGKGIIEVRGTGGTSIGRGLEWTVRRAYPLLGQTLFERQTFDLLQSIAIIRSEKNVGKIIVFGNGASAVIAIYAALLDQDIAGIILDKPIATHFNGGPEFLNVLKIGDIPHNLALLFPRPITFINNLPSVFSQVKKLYQKYGEGDKVQTIPALSQWTR